MDSEDKLICIVMVCAIFGAIFAYGIHSIQAMNMAKQNLCYTVNETWEKCK